MQAFKFFQIKSTAHGAVGNHGESAQKLAMVAASCDQEVYLSLQCMEERSAQDHQQFCKHAILILALKVRDIVS